MLFHLSLHQSSPIFTNLQGVAKIPGWGNFPGSYHSFFRAFADGMNFYLLPITSCWAEILWQLSFWWHDYWWFLKQQGHHHPNGAVHYHLNGIKWDSWKVLKDGIPFPWSSLISNIPILWSQILPMLWYISQEVKFIQILWSHGMVFIPMPWSHPMASLSRHQGSVGVWKVVGLRAVCVFRWAVKTQVHI